MKNSTKLFSAQTLNRKIDYSTSIFLLHDATVSNKSFCFNVCFNAILGRFFICFRFIAARSRSLSHVISFYEIVLNCAMVVPCMYSLLLKLFLDTNLHAAVPMRIIQLSKGPLIVAKSSHVNHVVSIYTSKMKYW